MKHTHVRTSVIANVSVPASQTPPTNIPFGDHREVLFFFCLTLSRTFPVPNLGGVSYRGKPHQCLRDWILFQWKSPSWNYSQDLGSFAATLSFDASKAPSRSPQHPFWGRNKRRIHLSRCFCKRSFTTATSTDLAIFYLGFKETPTIIFTLERLIKSSTFFIYKDL